MCGRLSEINRENVMTSKILKTAEELAKMIKDRLPHHHHDVEVRHDPHFGWGAFLVSPVDEHYDESTRVTKEAQEELRLMYDMMP